MKNRQQVATKLNRLMIKRKGLDSMECQTAADMELRNHLCELTEGWIRALRGHMRATALPHGDKTLTGMGNAYRWLTDQGEKQHSKSNSDE